MIAINHKESWNFISDLWLPLVTSGSTRQFSPPSEVITGGMQPPVSSLFRGAMQRLGCGWLGVLKWAKKWLQQWTWKSSLDSCTRTFPTYSTTKESIGLRTMSASSSEIPSPSMTPSLDISSTLLSSRISSLLSFNFTGQNRSFKLF